MNPKKISKSYYSLLAPYNCSENLFFLGKAQKILMLKKDNYISNYIVGN